MILSNNFCSQWLQFHCYQRFLVKHLNYHERSPPTDSWIHIFIIQFIGTSVSVFLYALCLGWLIFFTILIRPDCVHLLEYMYVQMDKCGDYFQAEDGPREFGNICIATKWIRTTGTSLVLRLLEVNRKEVKPHISFRISTAVKSEVKHTIRTLALY